MNAKISMKRAAGIFSGTNEHTVTVTDLDINQTRTLTVHTNHAGEGLWVNGRQWAGTCDFSAGRNASAAIRREIAAAVRSGKL